MAKGRKRPSPTAMVPRRPGGAKKVPKKRKTAAINKSLSSQKMYTFSRYVTADNQDVLDIQAGQFSAGLAKAFALNNVVNVSDFQNLFDQYKIIKVVCYFKLQTNPDAVAPLNSTTGVTAANFYPKLWYIQNDDDLTALNLDQIKQRQGVKCQVLEPNKMISFVIKPRILIQTYSSSISTGYAPKYGMLIDMANPGVPHYGMKCVFEADYTPVTNAFRMRVDYKYVFACRGVL